MASRYDCLGVGRDVLVERHAHLVVVANVIFYALQLVLEWGAAFTRIFLWLRRKGEHCSHRGSRKNYGAAFRDLDIADGGSYSFLASNVLDSHWRMEPFPDLKSACPRRSRASGNLCHSRVISFER